MVQATTAYCQLTNFLHEVQSLLKPPVPEVEDKQLSPAFTNNIL